MSKVEHFFRSKGQFPFSLSELCTRFVFLSGIWPFSSQFSQPFLILSEIKVSLIKVANVFLSEFYHVFWLHLYFCHPSVLFLCRQIY